MRGWWNFFNVHNSNRHFKLSPGFWEGQEFVLGAKNSAILQCGAKQVSLDEMESLVDFDWQSWLRHPRVGEEGGGPDGFALGVLEGITTWERLWIAESYYRQSRLEKRLTLLQWTQR